MIARALSFLVVVFLVVPLPNGVAHAQTTGTATATITLPKVVDRRDNRDTGLNATTINYNDCIADDALTLAVMVKGASSHLEVWTGLTSSNCGDLTYRTTNPSLCWQIGSTSPAVTGTIPLKVRDLLPREEGSSDEALCEALAKDTSKGSGTLKVNFLLTEGSNVLNAPTSLAVQYDLLAPPPPTGVSISVGETRLFPEWDAPAANLDVSAYELYCEPIASLTSCQGTLLVPGEHPPVNDSLKTARISKTGTSGVVEGLTNYTPYACGVAAVDGLSNVGTLSMLACETPQPVNGYFKSFRAAGGTAGGGYCSFGRAVTTPETALLSLLAAGGLFVRRQRRRSSSRVR